MKLFYPHGELSTDNQLVELSPEKVGWNYCGLKVLSLSPDQTVSGTLDDSEAAVFPLVGSATVSTETERYVLRGRTNLWHEVTDLCFLGLGTKYEISADEQSEIAVAYCRTDQPAEPRYFAREQIGIELRGAGQSSRQINELLTANVSGPTKLIVVEVITPEGNWSSYPPHKHDQHTQTERELEEIYYYRIAGPNGFGFHRTYTNDGSIDETVTVADGDIFCIPKGYHGPCVAAPGHDMYYLNVMAGPAPEREWLIETDPDYAWLWEHWKRVPVDPRLPYLNK